MKSDLTNQHTKILEQETVILKLNTQIGDDRMKLKDTEDLLEESKNKNLNLGAEIFHIQNRTIEHETTIQCLKSDLDHANCLLNEFKKLSSKID